MEDELRFTEDAELNRYIFYSDLNEINIFIEDVGKEYEYETIFFRLFGEKYRITAIISAGGKEGVKKAFSEFGIVDKDNPQKNNFYIVDGDFERYLNHESMINDRHFIYLKYYNIENYYIDENAILKFSKGKLHMLDSEVQNMVKYPYWKKKIVNQAKELFLLYCAVQKRLPSVPNVGRNEYLFIDSKTGFERDGAYNDYYDYIVKLDNGILAEIQRVKNIYESINGDNYFGLICGKFLLTSLYVYLRGIIKKNFTREELKWALLCDFDISSLAYVREMVDAVCIP